MKYIELTLKGTKEFNKFDTKAPASAGHLLIEIPHPEDPSVILVGVVHPHAVGEGLDFHKRILDKIREDQDGKTGI